VITPASGHRPPAPSCGDFGTDSPPRAPPPPPRTRSFDQPRLLAWLGRSSIRKPGMIIYHTMAKAKVAVTIDSRILDDLDALIAADRFPNRSQAVEAALADKIDRLRHTRLAREAAKLDPRQEQAEADEGLAVDAATWPKY